MVPGPKNHTMQGCWAILSRMNRDSSRVGWSVVPSIRRCHETPSEDIPPTSHLLGSWLRVQGLVQALRLYLRRKTGIRTTAQKHSRYILCSLSYSELACNIYFYLNISTTMPDLY